MADTENSLSLSQTSQDVSKIFPPSIQSPFHRLLEVSNSNWPKPQPD